MNPTLQPPLNRRGTPPLPNKLFDTRVKIAIEAAEKEFEAYILGPTRTECEKIIAQTVLGVIRGMADNLEVKEIQARLDEFFQTLKDYEDSQAQVKESFETRISELSEELAEARRSKGVLPFSAEDLDKRISDLQRQKSDAIEIQIRAEDEWKEAERSMNGYRPGVGEGKAKVDDIRRELRTAYETRGRNYSEITKSIEGLKQKLERLKSIKESIKVLSTATLE